MREIPRALAIGLILVFALVGAGGGAIVGVKMAQGNAPPPATAIGVPPNTPIAQRTATGQPQRPTATLPASPTIAVPNTPQALTAGPLSLTPTFASIGVELFFTGDDNGNASATLEFKPADVAEWRAGLPLWRVGDVEANQGRAFYGSALLLDAGKVYDLRITLSDPDGVRGERVIVGRTTTRAEDVAVAATLKPSYFVSPSGNDEAAGNAAAPWRTLNQALKAAPPGAIVQVAPGSYAPPTVVRDAPITLLAEKPAVDDNREAINAGQRSVIEPQTFSAPRGASGGAATAPWVAVTLTGPATGKDYTVWQWRGGPLKDATRLTVATDRGVLPQRVAHWDRKSGQEGAYRLDTPAGWAEVLYTNQSYNFGFAAFEHDLYVRLPGDRNPNDFYVTVAAPDSDDTGRWTVNGQQVRISGFELRALALWYMTNSSGGIIDHNLFLHAAINYYSDSGATSRYSTNQLVEHNRFLDTGTWSVDPAWPAIPWLFIKAEIWLNGAATKWGRVGAEAETTAVGGRGGAQRLVVRRNTIDGFFNGVGGYNEGYDRYSQRDTDIYENLLRHIADDSFEPEQQGINWRIWGNRLEDVSVAVSTGPLAYGPVYFFRNEVWRLGAIGVAADGRGMKGVGIVGFKFSGNSKPAARIFVINNTFWTDQPVADGGNQYAGGGSNPERFYLRNNIFRMTRYTFNAPSNSPGTADRWDEDYNHFATTATDRGLGYSGNKSTVGAYRAASGQGANSNRADTAGQFHTEPGLVDPANGNVQLLPTSPQIDAGTPVPNIADRPGIDYQGSAPDLGARER